MKLLPYASPFASLVVGSLFASTAAAKITFDTSGKCVEANPATFNSQKTCGERGFVRKPAGAKSYPAFHSQECASRCYAAPGCESFDIVHGPQNGTKPGRCTIYTESARKMGFKKSKNSHKIFYAADCYESTAIDDTPVVDSGFNAPSAASQGDAWSESGSVFTHNNENGNFVGTINTAYSSDNGEPFGRIGQKLNTCPGQTYQLTYENADGYTEGFGLFEVEVNGHVIRSSRKSIGDGLTEQPPLYFTTSSSTATLAFISAQEPGDGSSAFMYEVLDNVVVKAVYRGSLPPGTVVPTV